MNTVSLNKPHHKIGAIIKIYREKLGLNQAVVAHKAEISTSMLSQIERGIVSPSIDTLFAVCNSLGMDVTHLFRSVSDKQQVRIRHQGERLKHNGDGVEYEQLAVSTDPAHPSEIFLLELAPQQRVGLSEAGHEGEELGFVLCGSAVLVVNGVEYELKPGDSLSFNALQPHSLQNRSNSVFRAVWNALPPHKDYLEIE